MGGDRRVPGERLVDAERPPLGVEDQVLGRQRVAERDPGQRLAGGDLLGLAGGLRARRGRLWMRRLVAPAARHIDRAEQHLQQMQRAAGLEAVGMGRDAAHRMQRDRAAAHRLVTPPGPVGPRHRELDLLLEGGVGDLGGEPPDRLGRDAAGLGDRFGRIARVEIALGDELEHRHGAAAVGQHGLADERGATPGSMPRRRATPTASRTSGSPSSLRAKSPSSAAPGAWITSQAALV